MVFELFSTGAPVINEGFRNNNNNNNKNNNNQVNSMTEEQLDATVEMIRTILDSVNSSSNNKNGRTNGSLILEVLCSEGVSASSSTDPNINMISLQINMILNQLTPDNKKYVLERLCNENFTNHSDLDEPNDEDGEDGEDSGNVHSEQNLVENDEDEEENSNNLSLENFQNEFNNNEFTVRYGNNFHLDLVLRSLLYACVFYLLANPDTLQFVCKKVPGVKKSNSLLVMMVVFFVVYYLLNQFI